jgi:ArsR family transcriptional regulator
VADLGTGAGRLLASLRTRGKRVIGIDASPNMLARAAGLAREAGWTDVELRLGALEHLPLRDGEIDVAVAHQVLHHAAQPAIVLEEARRVLRPGGWLIVADFLPHDREWMREELADLWLGFDPAVLSRMLRTCGFLDVSLRKFQGRGDQLGMFVATARRPENGDRKGDTIAKPRASRDPRPRAVKARSAIRGAVT